VVRRYSLAEAQQLLPAARDRVVEVAAIVADLRDLEATMQAGRASGSSIDRLAELEASVEEAFGWFERHGIQVKSLRPALLDFPARATRGGATIEVLLCWRDDEDTIAYYHPPDTGYRTREPVALLDAV
jgi:hypothetical protein